MSKEHKYYLGKCDAIGGGAKRNEAYITWEFKDGKFSMCAEIWMASKRDIIMGGQCVREVAAFFPEDEKAQRMVEIWERWHLNDLVAGSPAQMKWLRDNPLDPKEYAYPASHYDVAGKKLEEAGLNPDPDYIHNEKPYKYGHAWLKEEIPADVAAEIESWG